MTILNVSQTSISFVENGTRNLTKEQMAILTDRYGEDTVAKYQTDDITTPANIQGNITPEPQREPSEVYLSLIDIINHQQAQMDALLENNTLMQRRIDKLLSIIEKQYQM